MKTKCVIILVAVFMISACTQLGGTNLNDHMYPLKMQMIKL